MALPYGWIIFTLFILAILMFIISYLVNIYRSKKSNSVEVIGNSKIAKVKNSDEPLVLPPVQEMSKAKEVTMRERITAKFTFSEVPKRYYLIQQVTPIGTAKKYGQKFHAGVVESKGKLWLENRDYDFFVEKPDEKFLIILDNQEGFEYKNLGSQWLLQGYDLSNGKANNVYTVDEQSDFLRSLEAKFWQYQGKKNLDKDKWSFWGLVILGLLIVFALGLNTYQTNSFMGNINEILENDVLDDTDKALMLNIIKNQEKLSKENIDLITEIKEKGLNNVGKVDKKEGVVFN